MNNKNNKILLPTNIDMLAVTKIDQRKIDQ